MRFRWPRSVRGRPCRGWFFRFARQVKRVCPRVHRYGEVTIWLARPRTALRLDNRRSGERYPVEVRTGVASKSIASARQPCLDKRPAEPACVMEAPLLAVTGSAMAPRGPAKLVRVGVPAVTCQPSIEERVPVRPSIGSDPDIV